jgi:hypothetical protein
LRASSAPLRSMVSILGMGLLYRTVQVSASPSGERGAPLHRPRLAAGQARCEINLFGSDQRLAPRRGGHSLRHQVEHRLTVVERLRQSGMKFA